MKPICLIIAAAVILIACKTSDRHTGDAPDVAAMKKKAVEDTAHYTTIEWLDSTFKDLGKIKLGQEVEVSYRFRNTGKSNLVILDVTASCGCTTPDKPEKPYAPGEEGVIKAKFDSKGRPVGEARKDIYVVANTTPSNSHSLSFRVEITN